MLDITVRLLIAAGIMIGTTYLPTLSAAVAPARMSVAEVPAKAERACIG